uniref:Uncharacterized protein n=1 Tax=Oryza nivara TaxID=4536 RepID=A0A0E0GRU9_ORYNI
MEERDAATGVACVSTGHLHGGCSGRRPVAGKTTMTFSSKKAVHLRTWHLVERRWRLGGERIRD